MRLTVILYLFAFLVLPCSGAPEHEELTAPLVVEFSYIVDALANISGGKTRGSDLLGSLLVDFKLDGEAALGWKGASFEASVLGVHGGPFTDLIGDFQTVSNIEAPQTINLFRAYYQQAFWNEKFTVLLGLYNVDSEFDIRDTAELFVHSSPGTGGDLGQTGRNGPGIFPVGALGGRLRYEDRGWYAQTAVVEGVPGDPDDPFGITLELSDGEGLFVIGEVGRVWTDDVGQLGKVGFGAWGFTDPYETHLSPDIQVANQGAYLSLEKALYRETGDPRQGLTGYLRTGVAEGSVNPIQTFLGGGLVYTGVFEGRPADQFGLSVNSGFAGTEFIESGPNESHETAIELTYSFVLNENISIQPDLMYVINPGFDPELQNSLILGLRATAAFSTF